jgi:hypothetical protein
MIQHLLRRIQVWQWYIGTSTFQKNISQRILWILLGY